MFEAIIMNYLSYFIILNFVLLTIYGIIAYRLRTFRHVKFRFSGFIVVKLLIRFCLINLFIYLLFQFSTLRNSFNRKSNYDIETVLVLNNAFNKSFDELKFSVFSDQIADNNSSYSLLVYEREQHKLKIVIPKTSYLSFITYLRNKDLKNIKLINIENLLLEERIKDKEEGFYIKTSLGSFEQISTGSLSQKEEYLGFSSTLDLYLLILLGLLLLSELFLSFQIIKY